jgi:phospholipase C
MKPLTAVLAGVLALGVAAATPVHASTQAAPRLEGIPHFDHVVVLVEENESEASTFGPGSPAHYLNSLRSQGVFLPKYFGTGHASLDNYITMVSGQPGNGLTNSDCETVSLFTCAQTTRAFSNGRHLGDQLDAAHVSWKSYMDTTPTPCFHGPYTSQPPGVLTPDPYQGNSTAPPAFDYADRHNPFIYFPNFIGNNARCVAHQRPFTELAGDISNNTLPAFSFITPDTCHDGHDATCANGQPGGLVGADAWLADNVPALVSYLAAHNGLLIVTFDEGDAGGGTDGRVCFRCVSGGAGGQVGAVLVSPRLPQGATVTTAYDHYSLLRTLEDSFGVSEHLNLSAQARPMKDAFAGSH